jgi:hypothetical protein
MQGYFLSNLIGKNGKDGKKIEMKINLKDSYKL